MKKNFYFCLVISLFLVRVSYSQLSITAANTNYTIDFDNTVTGVNNGAYDGSGFSSSPDSGQLNSNAWAATGMSDGDINFGDNATSGDFARGSSTGGVGTGGFYAFEVGSSNFAFGIQPTGSDWAPGSVTLKIQNNTGLTINSFDVSYNIYVYNDQNKSNSFNFSYSEDNTTYTDVSPLDFTSPVAGDASPSWNSTHKSTTITSINVPNGGYFYLRWSGGDEISGSGSMDEFALDDIVIKAVPAPTQVFFDTEKSFVNEGDGTYTLKVKISNPSSSNSTSADVVLVKGDPADISSYSTQTVTFLANSSADQDVTINITDDGDKEGKDTLIFELKNISGGSSAEAGEPDSSKLIIIDNDVPYLIINEVLADPPDGLEGDANGDGVRNGLDDEFVEILNSDGSSVNISGWKLYVGSTLKYTFPASTTIPDGQSVVVFGGGSPNSNIPGTVETASGHLNLTNTGDQVSLKDGSDFLIDSYTYGSEGNDNQSLARNPDITGNFVKHNTIASNPVDFSPGRSNVNNSPEPVELTSFTANVFGNNVELNWNTATEVNNYGFDVERSPSPTPSQREGAFQKIGFVQGFGNSNVSHDYTFIDKNLNPGNYYYRLKQIDIDGQFEYSKTIDVNLKGNLIFKLDQNFPNPFNPETKIKYSIPNKSYVSLKVFDILGNEVADLIEENEKAGNHSVIFSSDKYNLASGIYFYELKTENFIQSRKMILLR